MNNLPKGWTENTLKELIKIKGGKRLPKGQSLVLMKTNHPYIRITDLDNNSVKKGQLQFITNDVFSIISRYIVNTNDIILSIVGTVGLVSLIDSYLNNANLTENCVKLTPLDKEYLYYKYFFYYLISNNGQYEINKNTVGAVQKKLPIYGIENIKIYLPSLIEQKAIADILSSFDNKIELLKEQNKTLETMAQAIFKEWFVKFNYPNATGEMIDSEIGKIPKDWKIGKIKDVGKIICGKTPSKFNEKNYGNEVQFIKIPDMHNNIFILNTIDNLSKIGADSQKNKYLSKGSICISCIATVGLVAITTTTSQTNQQINSIIPINEFCTEFIYFSLIKLKQYLSNLGSGTVTLNVNTTTFSNIEIIIPNETNIGNFNKIVNPMFNKIKNNTFQIQALQNTRDTLLPKLMNGKLRIKGFEE
jgi:type I restriction enzyme S subunit